MQENHSHEESEPIIDESEEVNNSPHPNLFQPPSNSQPPSNIEQPMTPAHTNKEETSKQPQPEQPPMPSSFSPKPMKQEGQQPLISPLERHKNHYVQAKQIQNRIISDVSFYFKNQLYSKLRSDFLCVHSIIPKNHPDRTHFSEIFTKIRESGNFDPTQLGLDLKTSRAVAAVLGMAIADALGASTQFQYFEKKGLGVIKNGFKDIKRGRHGKIGIWTDDASMGLCLADSILLNDYLFNPVHMRYLFTLWLRHGLNNGGRPHSIGLGGNISISMEQFMEQQLPYTEQGDKFNNGNGSLMRLAPVPVAYSQNWEMAGEYSSLQSMTTHNGQQAAQCCKLMSNIIVALINRPEDKDGKEMLIEVCDSFKSKIPSVQYLARGKCESEEIYQDQCKTHKKFKLFNKSVLDRNWNWRDENHTYAPTRLKQQPGYIGSYCMDALAMALHTVYFSSNWKEVAIVNADMGGDCDTVGSIAGQIAGAIYGVQVGMLHLYQQMQDFKTGRYEAFLKAYLLATKKGLNS